MKFLLILFSSLCISTVHAQIIKPTSNNEFVMECMKVSGEGTSKKMALWLPYNFWEIVGKQMKVSPEFIVRLTNQMKNYMMFCVVDYSLGTNGMAFNDDIGKTIELIDSSNKVFRPLSENDINDEAKTLINNLKPTLAIMFGQFGSGMQIFVFKADQMHGKLNIDVKDKNSFSLGWNNTKLNWELPFSSVFPVKFCPTDNAEMKGIWQYCPMHGVKLR